jgi:hypothetical protein
MLETQNISNESSSTHRMPAAKDASVEQPPSTCSIATRMTFAASAEEVWNRLMFYEQIDQRPPAYLRMLLPVPIRTVGRKSHVGDQARCLYEGGHLIKRVTQVEPGRLYAFQIVEQMLAVGGGMRLSGGEYTLDERASDRTEVQLTTHYASRKWPRWLWEPMEATVCHAFHRHILGAMRRSVESR